MCVVVSLRVVGMAFDTDTCMGEVGWGNMRVADALRVSVVLALTCIVGGWVLSGKVEGCGRGGGGLGIGMVLGLGGEFVVACGMGRSRVDG